jgi:tetratricopeptide (TPR) repeat protein
MKAIFLSLTICSLLVAASWRDDLKQAARLEQVGDTTGAEQVYGRLLEEAKGLNAAQLNALGMELYEYGRKEEVERVYRQSLEAWDRLGPKVAGSRAITAGNLGSLLMVEGRYEEAEPLLIEHFRNAEIADAHSLDTARAASALAALQYEKEELQSAESYAGRADGIFSELAGPQEEQAANQRLLASILIAGRRFVEAEALLHRMIQNLPDRLQVGPYSVLVAAAIEQNRLDEAESLARRALDLARRVLPPAHPLLAVCLNNLGQIQRFQGQYLEAEKSYREAINVWKGAFGASHPNVGKGLMNLAAFYHERERETGAEDLYRQALAIFDISYGKAHPLTLVARNELGDVLRAEHRYSESEKLSRETIGALEKLLGETDPRVTRARANYARIAEETRVLAYRSRRQGAQPEAQLRDH